ncbi:DUF6678 family protein [Lacrimispora brassicae]
MGDTHSKLTVDYFDELDFGDGVKKKNDDESYFLSVQWNSGIYLKIRENKYTGAYYLTVGRDGTSFYSQLFSKANEHILKAVEHCVRDIQSGKYKNKKTEREAIQEIIVRRGLTSFMNDTKWSEFRAAMLEEMPFEPPYDYKTLFDEDGYINKEYVQHLIHDSGPSSFCSYDDESFNNLNYKSLEWVIVRPKFFSLEGGQLVKKKIWHDAELEFIKILKKYNIPYELENGAYIIYGYK